MDNGIQTDFFFLKKNLFNRNHFSFSHLKPVSIACAYEKEVSMTVKIVEWMDGWMAAWLGY